MDIPENWSQIADEGFPFEHSIRQSTWFNPIVNRVVSIPTNTVGDDVIVRITDGDGEEVSVERFDSKEEAKDFAEKWMRKHEMRREMRPRRSRIA